MEGHDAPNFTLPLSNDQEFTLYDIEKPVVLFFYPKDDTPGCTKEAKEFSELFEDFQKISLDILGISPDSITSHKNFVNKYSLKFPLLSDWNKDVAQAYGVWTEKSMFGKKYMGILRSTFIIDQSHVIKRAFYKVKPSGHAAQVLKICHELFT